MSIERLDLYKEYQKSFEQDNTLGYRHWLEYEVLKARKNKLKCAMCDGTIKMPVLCDNCSNYKI